MSYKQHNGEAGNTTPTAQDSTRQDSTYQVALQHVLLTNPIIYEKFKDLQTRDLDKYC